MSSYVSAFLAIGKRVSIDFKIFGGHANYPDNETVIQFESQDLNHDTLMNICENIIPRVVVLLSKSPCPKDIEAGVTLAKDCDYSEYQSEQLVHLMAAILSINRDPLNASEVFLRT